MSNFASPPAELGVYLRLIIDGNSAQIGGGIANLGGQVTITNSTISGNNLPAGRIAEDWAQTGGGTENQGGQITVTNSTISGNKIVEGGINPRRGGGINNRSSLSPPLKGGTLKLLNVTIANNSLPGPGIAEGGGIYNEAGSTVDLTNTIIDGNSAPSGPDCFGTLSSGDYNLISKATGCNNIPGTHNITNQSAGLNPLGSNGGPTKTHALSEASLAIDKGTDMPGLNTDQRGYTRRVDGNGDCLATRDMGAFEFKATPNPTPCPPRELIIKLQ